jgi:hypothetical protein
MRRRQRFFLFIGCALCLALMWYSPISGLTTLVVGGAGLWLARLHGRSGANPYLQTAGHDFSLRPVLWSSLTAVGCFVAALVWVAASARFAPDTNVGAAIVFGPSIAALIVASVFFGRALRLFTQGRHV